MQPWNGFEGLQSTARCRPFVTWWRYSVPEEPSAGDLGFKSDKAPGILSSFPCASGCFGAGFNAELHAIGPPVLCGMRFVWRWWRGFTAAALMQQRRPAALGLPGGGGRSRSKCEVLHAYARFLGPLSFWMILQECLVGLERVRVARLLPIAFLVQLLDAGLSLSGKLAVRIILQKLLIGVCGIRSPGFLPRLLAAQPEMYRARLKTAAKALY